MSFRKIIKRAKRVPLQEAVLRIIAGLNWTCFDKDQQVGGARYIYFIHPGIIPIQGPFKLLGIILT